MKQCRAVSPILIGEALDCFAALAMTEKIPPQKETAPPVKEAPCNRKDLNPYDVGPPS